MEREELIECIKDLLEDKTEYYLDSKFPRKTFETFMKENAK